MTFAKAHKLLTAKYEWAKNTPYIQDPVAWALYQVWKEADEDSNRNRRKKHERTD